jgi:hypothetical protein
MRRQIVVPSSGGLVLRTIETALALGRGVRRGVIRAVAIATMLVIYAVTSLGSIGTSVLGVAGVSSAALLATTAPANARRRWRRGRGRYRRHRGRGFYWGGFRRRRRRRYRGPGIYFRF